MVITSIALKCLGFTKEALSLAKGIEWLGECCKAIIDTVPDLSGRRVYFLLDEFENLAEFQQKVVNTLAKLRPTSLSIKLATRAGGLKCNENLQGEAMQFPRDYIPIYLDYDVGKKDYRDLLLEIGKRRLKAEGFAVDDLRVILESATKFHPATEREMEAAFEKMLEASGQSAAALSPEKLKEKHHQWDEALVFRVNKNKQKPWTYAGFDAFVHLSSGIISNFIELCKMTFYMAAWDGIDVRSGGVIPWEIQNEAAYKTSEVSFDWIPKNIPTMGPAIARYISDFADVIRAKLLGHTSEPLAGRIELRDPQALENAVCAKLAEIIDEALRWSVLQTPPAGQAKSYLPKHRGDVRPNNYYPNRILAPHLRISPDYRWTTPFSTNDLLGLLDESTRVATRNKLIGDAVASSAMTQLEVLLRGVFEKRRFLDLVRYFIVFEDDGAGTVTKKVAGYHQFHAVRIAVEETIRASGESAALVKEPGGGYFAKHQPGGAAGDRRIGVIWHTQGSGKSLTMAFYAGRLVTHSSMENPTIVVITDRNDLDDQLFGTFSRCHELLRQRPAQAESREHLRSLLKVASGGVVFTTVHKFFTDEKGEKHPPLSERRNIVVIADEAHRSQYDFVDGFARRMREALPHASWIGFTGTPIEKADANTRAVFGDYISIYDILRAVEDKATVPIYYEGRLAKLELKANEKPKIDPDFEEATEGEELSKKEYLKTKWAALEKIVGADKRLGLIAEDLVKHWEARLEVMDGKAMIVCMSRRICVDLYDQLVKLRPDWHHDADDKGMIKVVMTGSADDGPKIAGHARNKVRREALAKRFKDASDPLKIVLVRDMWLTGFDVPCLHTMYVDKPMRGHGLMQAIARVNRVFKDKPGGLVVDYLGLAYELKKALATYTESGGHGETAIDQEEAVAVMLEKYEICRDFFHKFDRSAWTTGTPAQKLSLLPVAQEHILKPTKDETPDEKKNRYLQAVTELSKAFALSVPHDKALAIRDDVGFFQAVRAALSKSTGEKQKSPDQIDAAIRQIISRAVASDKVIDIFAAAGLKRPDLSILSDEFLAEVRNMPLKNLAVETLRKLLNNEIKLRQKKFLIQSRSFAEMLEESIRKYQNRAIEAAAVIEELIQLAKHMREANKRGENLKLSDDELAFYDALEVNDSAVKVLGEPTLTTIARELVEAVRNSVTIDWTEREAVRAKIRVMVKRILRKHGYPPDKQEKATQTVLQQAELLCADWAT